MPGAIGAIAKPLIGSVVGKAAGKLFGSRGSAGRTQQTIAQRDLVGFRGTGMSADFNKRSGRFDIRRSAGVDAALDATFSTATAGAAEFRGLRDKLGPGFRALGRARLDRLGETRRRAVGGLRETLRRRRVGGSTFERLEVQELEKEFALEADRIEAESFLQSLSAASELIGKEFELAIGGVTTILNQMNFETQVATNLVNSANSLQASANAAQASIAQVTAQVDSIEAAGMGAAFEPAVTAITDGLAGLISPKDKE